MSNNGVLNLDELFGEARPVKVRWQGKLHELRRPEALGPRDLVRYERLTALMNEAQALTSTPSAASPERRGEKEEEERAAAIETAIDEMLRMIGPTLLTADPPLSFVAKSRVLQYYTDQVVAPMVAPMAGSNGEKKAAEEPTGGMSSAG